MSKRLAMLESLTAGGSKDPFAWYGLAMEYKNLGRNDEALTTFTKLRELDPNYLAAYLMAGQAALALEDVGRAKEWLQAGLALAEARGDAKTAGEIHSLLLEAGE